MHIFLYLMLVLYKPSAYDLKSRATKEVTRAVTLIFIKYSRFYSIIESTKMHKFVYKTLTIFHLIEFVFSLSSTYRLEIYCTNTIYCVWPYFLFPSTAHDYMSIDHCVLYKEFSMSRASCFSYSSCIRMNFACIAFISCVSNTSINHFVVFANSR